MPKDVLHEVNLKVDLPIKMGAWMMTCEEDTIIFFTREEADTAKNMANRCTPSCGPHTIQAVRCGAGMRFLKVQED